MKIFKVLRYICAGIGLILILCFLIIGVNDLFGHIGIIYTWLATALLIVETVVEKIKERKE